MNLPSLVIVMGNFLAKKSYTTIYLEGILFHSIQILFWTRVTPIGDLKECEVEKKWSEIYENGEVHRPSFMKFGVKFGQLTKNQHENLTKLIGSISENSTDWEIDKGTVL